MKMTGTQTALASFLENLNGAVGYVEEQYTDLLEDKEKMGMLIHIMCELADDVVDLAHNQFATQDDLEDMGETIQ